MSQYIVYISLFLKMDRTFLRLSTVGAGVTSTSYNNTRRRWVREVTGRKKLRVDELLCGEERTKFLSLG